MDESRKLKNRYKIIIAVSIEEPPMLYELELEGLQKNADGYYRYEDVIARFEEALSHEYDYLEMPLDAAA